MRRARNPGRAAQLALRHRGAGLTVVPLANTCSDTNLAALGASFLLVALHLAAATESSEAQSPTYDEIPHPVATLFAWADDVWLALTDRDGSYFGRLADEGTFQRFNPLMDDEYELDLRTGLSTPSEDARWADTRRGMRVAGASINHPFVLNFIDWRVRAAISDPVDLLARYVRQRSLTAQRDYAAVGLRWRDALGSPWAFRGSLGLHFFKSSADLEFALARRWADQRGSSLTLDLRVAVLDAFNNLIFNALGVRPEETRAHFNYTTLPFATRLSLVGALPSVRFEVHGGLTTRSRVEVTFPATGDPSFALAERVGFVGALLQVTVSERVSLAAHGAVAHAATDRRFTPTSPADLGLREDTRTAGLRAGVAASETLSLELDLEGMWRPETRSTGGGPSRRDPDRQLFGQLAVVRRPLTGWTARLAYAVLDRNATLLPQLTAVNHRLVTEGGYRFASEFEVTGGLRWDLDDFSTALFDGGQLRFVASW